MNYYERNLGDYAKDAGHLSMLEHGAYTLLLDRYYATEAGIPDDQKYRVTRAQTPEQQQAVDAVLAEFFKRDNDLWIKNRCEEEISGAKARIQAARENGSKGGRPKKPGGLFPVNQNETQQKPNPSNQLTQSKALQSPVSILQSPVREEAREGIGRNPKPPSPDESLATARAVVGLDVESFDRWIEYRAKRKPAIKPVSYLAAAEQLAAFADQQSVVVKHSIANGYQGLFPPKTNGANGSQPYVGKYDRLKAERGPTPTVDEDGNPITF